MSQLVNQYEIKSSVLREETEPSNYINSNDKIEFWLSLVEQGVVPLLEVIFRGYHRVSSSSHSKHVISDLGEKDANYNDHNNDGNGDFQHAPAQASSSTAVPDPPPVVSDGGPINAPIERNLSNLFPEIRARAVAHATLAALIKVCTNGKKRCIQMNVHVKIHSITDANER